MIFASMATVISLWSPWKPITSWNLYGVPTVELRYALYKGDDDAKYVDPELYDGWRGIMALRPVNQLW